MFSRTFTLLSLLSLFLLTSPIALAQDVRIGVLGLFHSRQLTLSAAAGDAIVVTAAGKTFALEPNSLSRVAQIRISGDALFLDVGGLILRASEIRAVGRDNGSATFVLAIPGKVCRRYRGTLLVKAANGEVAPIVVMDLETAVASVVAAESAPDTPLEALKVQAVVTRSYLVGGRGRHHDFDFCDLTHCQFLREPPKPGSLAALATAATRGLVITFEEKPIAAMFTRSCGGRTRTPAELDMPANGYPYFSVFCDYCYKNPSRWQRHISQQDAARLLGKGEAGRLAVDRRRGWNAVPSNTFTGHSEDGEIILDGAGQGHGVGLCQRGAKAMAEEGAGFREIIKHYFPNITLAALGSPSAP